MVVGVDPLLIDKDFLGVGDDFNREGEYAFENTDNRFGYRLDRY